MEICRRNFAVRGALFFLKYKKNLPLHCVPLPSCLRQTSQLANTPARNSFRRRSASYGRTRRSNGSINSPQVLGKPGFDVRVAEVEESLLPIAKHPKKWGWAGFMDGVVFVIE